MMFFLLFWFRRLWWTVKDLSRWKFGDIRYACELVRGLCNNPSKNLVCDSVELLKEGPNHKWCRLENHQTMLLQASFFSLSMPVVQESAMDSIADRLWVMHDSDDRSPFRNRNRCRCTVFSYLFVTRSIKPELKRLMRYDVRTTTPYYVCIYVVLEKNVSIANQLQQYLPGISYRWPGQQPEHVSFC